MWGNLPDTLFHCLIKYLFINWLPFSMELALDWNWASPQKLEALEMNNVWPGIGSVMLFLSAYSDPSSNISLFLHQFFINFSISNKCIPRDQTMLQYHLSSQKKKKNPPSFHAPFQLLLQQTSEYLSMLVFLTSSPAASLQSTLVTVHQNEMKAIPSISALTLLWFLSELTTFCSCILHLLIFSSTWTFYKNKDGVCLMNSWIPNT